MEGTFSDRFGGAESPAHRLDPRAVIILVAAFAVTVVSTPPRHLLSFVIYAGMLSWACALSHVPLRRVALRATAVLPFSVLAAVWMPFVATGPTVALLGGNVHASVGGLWIFAGVAMKSYLGTAAAVWLISTTTFAGLLNGLRKMGAPALVLDMLALTYRYVFLLVTEAMRLRRAAAARGYRPRWLGQALLIGRLVGRLFVHSYERAERVYGAMLLRGFNGRMPTTASLRFCKNDAAVLAVAIPALLAARFYAR